MPDAERSVAIHVRIGLPRLAFGATWAFTCGAAAGLGAGDDLALTAARLVAGWFVAVPLLGAVWASLLVPPEDPAPATERADEGPLAVRHRRHLETLAVVALMLAVALLVGGAVLAVLALGLGAVGLIALDGGRPRAAAGAIRSGLEILVPGLVGWLAAGGAVQVAAPVLVANGGLAAAGAWAQANWLVPALILAVSFVHHGLSEGGGQAAPTGGRAQIWLGYIAAVAFLALAGRSLGAGAVALAFIAQWPVLALLGRPGDPRASRAAAPGAMLAMLAALVGAR